MKNQFVPLHVHSEFSALDGASKVKDITKKAADSGMPAMAITDHGVMNSMVSFYKAARSSGVKPIIGYEAYVAPPTRTRFDKIKLGDGEKNAHHMVLLAKNKAGAQNLNILCSAGHLEGYYYKPRIDNDLLRKHSEGLIALTACLGGAIPQALMKEDYKLATELSLLYKDIFKDDFYLELQDHGDPQQDKINKLMIKLSEDLKIPLVATNDSHFTNREDKEIHDMVLAISMGQTISSPKKMYYTPEHYFKTPEEMWEIELFKQYPDSLINTVRIAEKCNYVMELGVNQLPNFEVPSGHTQDTYLREITYRGLEARYSIVTEELRSRADFELEVIQSMGFPGYLLIVADFINWAKGKGIPVGAGRGSAAGSLVCYANRITDIDPIEHELLFERFLNPARVSMPDIDVDFCIERRHEVMDYVVKKYGDDRVCQIATFGTMATKQAFKDVARVLELPYQESDRISKMIPNDKYVNLSNIMQIEEFRLSVENNPKALKAIEIGARLEGTVRNLGTHAAGVIISKDSLKEICPLMQVKLKGDSEDGEIKLSCQSQLEQKDAEELGLLKMDFLGLRNLTMIDKTEKLIEKRRGIKINWESPEMKSMADPDVYNFICKGKTLGLFQIEGDGVTKLVLKVKPSRFEDLSVINALNRPGPLENGMDDLYVQCKHGLKEIEYPHPDLEPILKPTYSAMIYQEQIQKIGQVMAGYTLGEADLLRRAMGKKKPEEMKLQKSIFLEGAKNKGYDPKLAEATFDKMAKFAEYGFNKSHSAAYSVTTYQTAYLKTHFPAEFMACLMSSLSGQNDKILEAVNDCKYMGIKVLPPDINKSEKDFTVEDDNTIIFGLLSIKGIGEGFINSIVEKRGSGFANINDFCSRVSSKTYNSRSIENLIKSGSFDKIERNRALLVAMAERIMPGASKKQKSVSSGQTALFEEEELIIEKEIEVTEYTRLEELEHEKELIGIYVSSHPIEQMGKNYQFYISNTIDEISSNTKNVVIVGMIRSVKNIITKKGDRMAFLMLEDISGNIPAVCFPEAFSKFGEMINENYMAQFFGKIELDRDGQLQFVINKIKTIEELSSVHLNLVDFDEDKLKEIQRTISLNRGDTSLIFKLKDKTIVSGPEHWIKYSKSLEDKLINIIGKENISIK